MSSLYGSMTRSAAISLLNSRCAMILALREQRPCGLRSPESQHAESVWFLVPTLSSGVGKRLDWAPPKRSFELAVGVEPELPDPGRRRRRANSRLCRQ